MNGEQAGDGENTGGQNPFAAEDDEDSDGEGDFTIGDAEGDDDGKGKPHTTGTSASQGQESPLEGESGKNVGIPSSRSGIAFPLASASVLGRGKAAFPSLWPFGGSLKASNSAGRWEAEMEDTGRSHFRGWSANDEQSSDEDSDGEYGGAAFGGSDRPRRPKRRLSSTTEAKRRTSLEDDDEDEVVHVGMVEVPEKSAEEKVVGDDEELVEIQHAEMPGIGGGQQ